MTDPGLVAVSVRGGVRGIAINSKLIAGIYSFPSEGVGVTVRGGADIIL